MTAWGWVGLALAWAGSLACAWLWGRKHGIGELSAAVGRGYDKGREAATPSYADKAEAYRIAHQAGTRAAATATRATIVDALSLLPTLRCGGGHADHVGRSDVLRIVTPEGTP